MNEDAELWCRNFDSFLCQIRITLLKSVRSATFPQVLLHSAAAAAAAGAAAAAAAAAGAAAAAVALIFTSDKIQQCTLA